MPSCGWPRRPQTNSRFVGGVRDADRVKSVVGRAYAQGLDIARFDTAAEVVRHLGAVQAQLHDMALWAVGRRTTGLGLAELRQAFERGQFLRTHLLRPTWHFVDPDDIAWLLALTAPRIERLLVAGNKGLGLTEDHVQRGSETILAALSAGDALTRAELAALLAEAGLPHQGQALGNLVMHAEINALIVNGPMRGKQHTYVPLVPRPVSQTRDELLAVVAVRYGRGHGPFRAKDLAWWTSLTLTDSRRAIQRADLSIMQIDGEAYAYVDPPVERDVPRAMLLSNYDEYISYARDPHDYDAFAGTATDIMRGAGLLMVDGRLAGLWTRSMSPSTVSIQITTSHQLTASLRHAIHTEAAHFAAFVDREPDVTIEPPSLRADSGRVALG